MNKKRLAILFGGRSAEHEVSVASASSVAEAVNKDKYEVVPIGIDKSGRWYHNEQATALLSPKKTTGAALAEPEEVKPQKHGQLAVIPGKNKHQFIHLDTQKPLPAIDVVFPVLHGPFGEDGTVQGLLRHLDLPYVGPDVIGSVVGMDKDVMKRLFLQAGIPTAKGSIFRDHEKQNIHFSEMKKAYGAPLFIKPANMGSSVGVNKVENEQEFKAAVEEAFRFDTKIIIEEFIKGREIECAILGNEELKASKPGEIITSGGGFYSYKAKYVDESGTTLEIPAQLEEAEVEQIQVLAKKAFRTLCCEGLGRVDVFLTDKGEVYINEINTIPGFTKISMYPQLWNISGIAYPDLIENLIELAMQRFEKRKNLSTDVG